MGSVSMCTRFSFYGGGGGLYLFVHSFICSLLYFFLPMDAGGKWYTRQDDIQLPFVTLASLGLRPGL